MVALKLTCFTSQRVTVGTMADITVSFSSMVAEERTQSIEQEMNTAGGKNFLLYSSYYIFNF